MSVGNWNYWHIFESLQVVFFCCLVVPITALLYLSFFSYNMIYKYSIFQSKQTYFDSPAGADPVALNLGSMGKGQAWVNGHHIGRYWTRVAPKDGCQEICDYRGAYNSDKCSTNCGKPTQTWYACISNIIKTG